MKALKYSEILARNRELAAGMTGKPYKIAILSNIVVNQLGEILECALRERGINAHIVHGDFDNIVQDSGRLKDVDAAVVFWEAANLVDGLHAIAGSMAADELTALGDRVERELELVLSNLRDVPLMLLNRFSALPFVDDALRASALETLCDRLNSALNRMVFPHQVVVKLDAVLSRLGLHASVDFRQFQSAKALYTIDLFKSYVEHITPAFAAVTGKMRKVLVLDCDNTLWGGILGEDGAGHIQMSSATRPGRVFREVQQIVQGLRKQGVLLALCSKNNPGDVDAILRDHEDMLLRTGDFVAKKVNWTDKATNLRQLATELNLGLDSFVFVDDSAFELGLVADELPQVACVRVPETLSEYPEVMRRLGREFFVLARTSEDLRKTEMYKQEQDRTETKARFATLGEYLKSLGLVVRITQGSGIDVSRSAQLTQKTNQFNLTTRRYTEADVTRMLGDADFTIATFAVSDHYGDYGTTGLTIVRREATDAANIDTFLMSCRVIGRNVERAFFDDLVAQLQASGIKRLTAEFVRTPKNDQVSSFYDTLGFRIVAAEATAHRYELALAEYRPSGVDYIGVERNAG